jgi:hypothetical protein
MPSSNHELTIIKNNMRMELMMEYRKGLRNAAYVCQRLGILGGILWIINCLFFFVEFFSNGAHLPNFREVIAGYGGALIAAIVPIIMIYCIGGVVALLLDIEANTRKS